MNLNDLHARLSPISRYALSVFIFFVALLLRFLILPVESGLAFLTFYPATVICFYLCGIGPGALMTILSAATGYCIFTPPFWTFNPDPYGKIGVAVFVASAYLISLIVKQLKHNSEQLLNVLASQRKHDRALRLLSECNSSLIHAEKEHDLLTDICRLAVEKGGYLMAWVGFSEHDAAKTVRPVAQSGYEDGYLDNVNITWADTELGQGPTGTAIRTGKTIVNQNYLTNSKIAPWRKAAIDRGYQSSIALPLVSNDQTLGALTIYSPEPFSFGQEEITLLEELANNLAYGIETLRTRVAHEATEKKLEFLANHDSLTGLPNRLLLHDRFGQEAAIANRNQSAIAVLFLDLDNFKQINDSLGHQYGDRLLIEVASRLESCIRETDIISRQGGDEFVILLTNVRNLAVAEAIAQNIVGAFIDPFHIDDYTFHSSFSIGISLFPKDGQEIEELLKQADTALYQAKDAGRNTYRFFTQQMNTDALEYLLVCLDWCDRLSSATVKKPGWRG